jgi:ubiquinone biosynthesis protein COQ9
MEQELTQYLESLVTSAREGSYIFPPEAASEKIGYEIERRTRLKIQNLAHHDVETIESKVNAHVNQFVQDTLRAIDDVVASLKSNHATAFEGSFRNPADDPTWDFGWAKLLVRYVR